MSAFLPADDEGICQATKLIQAGECVAVPTETVYGLAADALNVEAVAKIFTIKGRPLIDPLIVHFDDPGRLAELMVLNPTQAAIVLKLSEHFWPGPLTIVAPKNTMVPDLVTANRDSVAVRRPAHPAMRALLKESQRFLAAPSANPFGYISPTCAAHVWDSLGERCPHIIDGGTCEAGVESTIIDIRNAENPRILRPGPISQESIQDVLMVAVSTRSSIDAEEVSLAPGQLERHYSPSRRLHLFPEGDSPTVAESPSEAIIYLARPVDSDRLSCATYWLSEDGDLSEVAHNLFALLRTLDTKAGIESIHCEMPSPGGIADAIRDRLNRASKR